MMKVFPMSCRNFNFFFIEIRTRGKLNRGLRLRLASRYLLYGIAISVRKKK